MKLSELIARATSDMDESEKALLVRLLRDVREYRCETLRVGQRHLGATVGEHDIESGGIQAEITIINRVLSGLGDTKEG